MSSNGNNPHQPPYGQPTALDELAESNKRAALAGQWRTPPVPTFPKAAVAPAASTDPATTAAPAAPPAAAEATAGTATAVLPPIPVNVSQLPGSTEDYAKALQEAYLRGAEAAAAMAAQQKMPTAVSCPDFSNGQQPQPPHQQHPAATAEAPTLAAPTPTMTTATSSTPPLPPGHASPQVAAAAAATAPQHAPHAVATMPQYPHATTTMHAAPPQQPPTIAPAAMATVPPAPTSTTTSMVPNPLPMAPPPVPQAAAPGYHVTAAAAPGVAAANPQPARAMSLPDMTTYAAQQEEEKRQKRLARNRASARLRRLRKKNLVDAYEQEVGILEKTLEQLKVHEWGKSDNAGALAEALSMDRGQQVLDLSERQKEAAALLEQQLEWVHMLEDIVMEDYVLHQLVSNNGASNPELQELAATLQLSPEQMRQVEESKTGWQDEWDALQTVKASLQAMQENEWLWNESVGAVAEQFMSILHKNQISKFLLWADHNAEAIDELDGVHASQGVPSGPVFAFGVESQPEGPNDDEK